MYRLQPVLAVVEPFVHSPSTLSLRVVDLAAAEAVARAVPLRLLVVGLPSAQGACAAVEADLSVGAARRRVAHLYPDLPVTAAVPAVATAEDLHARVIDEARRAGLVVVGRRWRADFRHSVQAELAGRAGCPVIVAPGGAGRRSSRPPLRGPIVVGVKGDDQDAPAIVFGLEEASLHDVPLQLVHVWSNIPDMELASVDPFVYDLAEARRDADRLIEAELDGWAQKYPEVSVQRIPLYQIDVATTLSDASAHASLLVLGPRRDSSGRRLLGPITCSLIDESRCPIAVTR